MRALTLLLLFFSFSTFAQTADQIRTAKRDSVKKYHCIFTYVQETISTTNYSSNGQAKGSSSARGIFIDFRVGEDGPIKNIGRKGKSLENVIKNDPEAYAEFKKAYKVHLRKKKICNALEYVGYAVIVGGAISLFVGLDNYETDGVTPPAVIGGVGVVGGLTQIIVFHKLTDKHMDAFSKSIQESIQIYNANLLAKIK